VRNKRNAFSLNIVYLFDSSLSSVSPLPLLKRVVPSVRSGIRSILVLLLGSVLSFRFSKHKDHCPPSFSFHFDAVRLPTFFFHVLGCWHRLACVRSIFFNFFGPLVIVYPGILWLGLIYSTP